ncbi:hypothetical protein ACMYSQ_011784 [Aspergillus niger]
MEHLSPPQFISHHVHHDLAFLCLSFGHWASHWYHGFLLSCHFRQPFQSIVGDSQLKMTAVPVWHTPQTYVSPTLSACLPPSAIFRLWCQEADSPHELLLLTVCTKY